MTSQIVNTANTIIPGDTHDAVTAGSARFLPIVHSDGTPLAPDDPRVPFARAVATAAVVIAELTVDAASTPTPCAEWDARQMAGHLVAVLERVAELPTGRTVDDMALVRDDLTVEEMSTAFAAAARRVHLAWTDEALGSMVNVPWGEIPGVVAMHVYTAEILIHTWDLATALGVEPQWHRPDVEAAVRAVQMGIPAEGRELDDMPFDPPAHTAPEAPAIHRLVAWVGRSPA